MDGHHLSNFILLLLQLQLLLLLLLYQYQYQDKMIKIWYKIWKDNVVKVQVFIVNNHN